MLDEPEIVMVDPKELRLAPPFSTVFTIKPEVSSRVTDSMKKHGFIRTRPIEVWRERNVVLDGHTRRQVAIGLGIQDVPVVFVSFESEYDALEYAYECQLARRQLTGPEVLLAVEAFDKIRPRGGDHCSEKAKASREAFAPDGKSAVETAKILGVGRATVERARVVLKDEEAKQSVLQGKASINMAARNVKSKKAKKAKPAQQIEKPTQQSAFVAESTTTAAALASAPPLPFAERADPPFVAVSTEKPRWDTQQYRMDVRIYNELKPLYDQLRDKLKEITGLDGSEVYGPAYRKTRALALMAHPRDWVDCPRCKATGRKNGVPCEACRMGRYKIPNL